MDHLKPKVQTWINNVRSGRIKSKTERVLSFIYQKTMTGGEHIDLFCQKQGRISTDELRDRIGMSHQTLTAILSNLQDEGIIKTVGEKRVGSEVYSYWQYETHAFRIAANIQAREKEKFRAWLKRGVSEFDRYLPASFREEFKFLLKEN